MLNVLRRRLDFVPPRLDSSGPEWEREQREFERDDEEREMRLIEQGLHSGLLDVHVRAMVWTTSPPTVPGWYWCRFKGAQDVIKVEAGFEYRPDPRVEWSSTPVPVPGPLERRR